jgi:uncharacterized metal-binding protein
MILACSGASNVGQLANQAAVELTREGFGKMSCLAAVGAHLGSFVKAVKNARHLVAIDGCPVACAKHVLHHAEASVHTHVVLYDLGIEKKPNTVPVQGELERVKAAVREACDGRVTTVGVHAESSPSWCAKGFGFRTEFVSPADKQD